MNARDELAEIIYRADYNDPSSTRIEPLSNRAQWEIDAIYRAADAILAAGYVKLPEPEIEWGVASKWGSHAFSSKAGADLNIELHQSCGENARLVKRLAASKPGPWEAAE